VKKIILFLISLALFLTLASPVKAAHFNLEPQTGEYTQEEEFSVKVNLDTVDQDVSGIDLIFSFNQDLLEVKTVDFNNLFTLNDSQLDNSQGRLKIYSTMNSSTASYRGSDRLVTLKVRTKKEGEAKLTFVCQSGQTGDDTNIWKKGGGDIVDCGALKEGVYKIKAGCQTPEVPPNVKAETGPGSGQVTLSWTKVSGAKHYNITYGPSSLNYQWGAPDVGDVDSYVVSGLEPGKPYYFIVTAVNDCGSSGARQEVAAYAGSGEEKEKYWQEPEVVDWVPDLPQSSPSPSAKAEASPLSSPAAATEETGGDGEKVGEGEVDKEDKPFPWSLPSWLKWLGGGLAGLIVLALIGKKLANREITGLPQEKETPPPPEEKDQFNSQQQSSPPSSSQSSVDQPNSSEVPPPWQQ